MATNEHSLTHFKQNFLDIFLLHVLKGAKESKRVVQMLLQRSLFGIVFKSSLNTHINSEIQAILYRSRTWRAPVSVITVYGDGRYSTD